MGLIWAVRSSMGRWLRRSWSGFALCFLPGCAGRGSLRSRVGGLPPPGCPLTMAPARADRRFGVIQNRRVFCLATPQAPYGGQNIDFVWHTLTGRYWLRPSEVGLLAHPPVSSSYALRWSVRLRYLHFRSRRVRSWARCTLSAPFFVAVAPEGAY